MRIRRLSYSICLVVLLALTLSACNLNISRTKPNSFLWSGGVVYYRCTENGNTTFMGEVQRVVVLGKAVRVDPDTFKVVEPKGRCETSAAR